MVEEYDYLFKTIVVGDGGVGKTALTIRFSKDFFTEDYKMTIGVDFHVKTIAIESHEGTIRCKLQIWDTGGQERFSSIRPMYYRGSLGALIIFDLTNYESFEHLPMWIEEVRANVRNEIPFLLVGNKSDLTSQRAVSMEEINDFSNKFDLYYMETSAKTGDRVGDCFSVLACLMIGEGVPDQLLAEKIVFSPGKIPISMTGSIQTPVRSETSFSPEPEIDFAAPPVPEPSPVEKTPPAPSFEPEPEIEFAAPPVPEPSPIEETAPAPSFEPEPEIEFAAPPVPEPSPVEKTPPAPSFEPEPEIEFAAPPVPEPSPIEEITSKTQKKPSQKLGAPSSTTFKPETVPFSSSAPVQVPPPEGFKVPVEIKQTETISSPSEKAVPFLSGEYKPSDSSSLIDYMPETILSKKEQKEIEKQKKLEEKERKIREAQLAKEEKERLAREAKEEKERLALEAKEEKERLALEAKEEKERLALEAKEEKERKIREAKEEKERKIREAKEEKERKIREAQEAKEAAKLEKQRKIEEAKKAKQEKKEKKSKKEHIIEPDIDISPVPTPPPDLFKKEEPSLIEALASKTKKEKKSTVFTPFTPIIETSTEEPSVLNSIPNIADLEKAIESRTPPSTQNLPFQVQETQKRTVICSQCGTMLSSDYAFCNKCGAPL
ncbi:MAG: GTP-binding protein [Promethearchaeota archaeon]